MAMVLVYRQKKIQPTSDFNYRQIESTFCIYLLFVLMVWLFLHYFFLEDFFYNSKNIIYIETY